MVAVVVEVTMRTMKMLWIWIRACWLGCVGGVKVETK